MFAAPQPPQAAPKAPQAAAAAAAARYRRAESIAPSAKRAKTADEREPSRVADRTVQDVARMNNKLMQTASRSRVVFSLIANPTHLRKNAELIQDMIQGDPVTLTAFGIGDTAGTFAYQGFSTEIVGISMLKPYRNCDVIARDVNTELLVITAGRKKNVFPVCTAIAIPETSTRASEPVRVRPAAAKRPASPAAAKRAASPAASQDDEDDVGPVRSGGTMQLVGTGSAAALPPPLLLYTATSMMLMSSDLAQRAWSAIDYMAPGLAFDAVNHKIVKSGDEWDVVQINPQTDSNGLQNGQFWRMECCGVLNDILLTMQEESDKYDQNSPKGRLFNLTLELIANPSASRFIAKETVEFGATLSSISYLFGRRVY
jgi:hypothetical protein